MQIKELSCTQFAGIRDRSISFTGGLNLVYGKNESGKSTLVNLLSRTLFQNARIDGRSDREFKELYFPGSRRGNAVAGDFADGKIVMDTPKGVYTLSKEWGPDSRCLLSTEEGVVRDQKKINALLKEALVYGEGVYGDLLLSSQRNTDLALQTILDAAKKTDAKKEITDAVSQAFAESDGLTADTIGRAIQEKIEEIAGKHWDMERGMPLRKSGASRWSSGLGEILAAYYALEDAMAVIATIQRLEEEADARAADYTTRDEAAQAAQAAYEHFHAFAGQLSLQSERRKTLRRLEQELAKYKEILQQWPQLTAQVEKAAALKAEKENRGLLDKYAAAQKLAAEADILGRELQDQSCPGEEEIRTAKAALKQRTALENSLCGMNLRAAIEMLGGHTVRITSLRTGQPLEIRQDSMAISEAVKITVPGVMEMDLAPANVHVPETEAAIARQNALLQDILGRYGAGDVEALEALARTYAAKAAKLESLSSRLAILLEGEPYENLTATAKAIPEVRSREIIDREILALCGTNNLLRYLTEKETIAVGYAREYTSPETLKAKVRDMETDAASVRESLLAAQDMPGEFAGIADPDAYLSMLLGTMKAKQKLREEALTAKTAAAGKLESYKENLTGDPAAEAEAAQRRFEQTRALLSHWLHIQAVFLREKEQIQNNPMQDIADSFTRYLGIISEGRVSSEFTDPEALNMQIYSGSSLLDYGKLSEGTKETVSLAFRLAVLDHLFPQGGGIIVFDDPFTDMDAERTRQACRLIQECAARHQVIFLTCKEEYAALLGKNPIRLA